MERDKVETPDGGALEAGVATDAGAATPRIMLRVLGQNVCD